MCNKKYRKWDRYCPRTKHAAGPPFLFKTPILTGFRSQLFVFDLLPLRFKLRLINFFTLGEGSVFDADKAPGREALDRDRMAREPTIRSLA